jgi:hypothetical protein
MHAAWSRMLKNKRLWIPYVHAIPLHRLNIQFITRLEKTSENEFVALKRRGVATV